MLTQLIKQANVTGITASAVATAKIPTTGTHYGLYLRCLAAGGTDVTAANIKTAIGNIVIRLNGEQIMEATATFFLDLQKFYGDQHSAGNVTGILPIFFAPSYLPSFAERSVYALGTANVQTFTVDMNILSTANMATIDVYSEISPEVRNVGQHIRIKKFPQNFSTTGDQEISTLPLEGASVGYKALHIEAGSGPGSFVRATVKLANYAIFDQVPVSLNNVLLQRSGRKEQSGYFHISFDRNNDLTSFLPMAGVQDFRIVINWVTTAPGNFNIYAEQIHGLLTKSAAK
jgi:hypothetical protein